MQEWGRTRLWSRQRTGRRGGWALARTGHVAGHAVQISSADCNIARHVPVGRRVLGCVLDGRSGRHGPEEVVRQRVRRPVRVVVARAAEIVAEVSGFGPHVQGLLVCAVGDDKHGILGIANVQNADIHKRLEIRVPEFSHVRVGHAVQALLERLFGRQPFLRVLPDGFVNERQDAGPDGGETVERLCPPSGLDTTPAAELGNNVVVGNARRRRGSLARNVCIGPVGVPRKGPGSLWTTGRVAAVATALSPRAPPRRRMAALALRRTQFVVWGSRISKFSASPSDSIAASHLTRVVTVSLIIWQPVAVEGARKALAALKGVHRRQVGGGKAIVVWKDHVGVQLFDDGVRVGSAPFCGHSQEFIQRRYWLRTGGIRVGGFRKHVP